MISTDEIIRGRPVTPGLVAAIADLASRVNIIRAAWGKPMIVTSGLRSQDDQKRINPKVTRSAHLEGRAVDISDPKGHLYDWLQKRPELLEESNLFAELGTSPGWVHLQSRPFGSYRVGGSRWFKA